MNPYQEIYVAYLRSRGRRTINDVETLYGIALILNIEGITLMQLRNLAITERGAPLNAASLKTRLEERKKLGLS